MESHQASLRTACKTVGISRSSYDYQRDTMRDQVVIEELQRLAENYPTYGFQMMFDKLRQEGFEWNHKRVYRLYKALNLNLRRKRKKNGYLTDIQRNWLYRIGQIIHGLPISCLMH